MNTTQIQLLLIVAFVVAFWSGLAKLFGVI